MASLEQQNHGNHPDGMQIQYANPKMALNHSVDLNKGLAHLKKPGHRFNTYNVHSPEHQNSGALQLHPQVTQLAPKQGYSQTMHRYKQQQELHKKRTLLERLKVSHNQMMRNSGLS